MKHTSSDGNIYGLLGRVLGSMLVAHRCAGSRPPRIQFIVHHTAQYTLYRILHYILHVIPFNILYSIPYSILYSMLYRILCILLYCVLYSKLYSILCSILCSILYSILYSFRVPKKDLGRFPGGGLGNEMPARTIAHSPPGFKETLNYW